MNRSIARALRSLADRLDPPRKLPIHNWPLYGSTGENYTTTTAGKVTWTWQNPTP